MKHIWMIIFLLLPIVGVFYSTWRVWHLLPFSVTMKWMAVGVIVALFCSILLAFSGTIEKMPLPAATATYEVAYSFLFILMYLVMLFLVLDLGRLVRVVPQAWLFDNAHTSIGILAFMLLLFGYGHIHYNNKVAERIDIKTDKAIGTDKKRVKLVLMSDLHLGYHNSRSDFKRWVDRINEEKPDLILIAGDLIDISVRPLIEENMAEEFHRLKAPVYACLGNHEYYSGQSKARQFYREAGITLLQDSVAKTGNLCIIGRDDRTNKWRKPLAKIIEQARQQGVISTADKLHEGKLHEFLIVLDHQPYRLDEAARNGIDFQLSGHTHRGQVWPISWITDALYEQSYGSLQKGNTRYYISSGMGIWGGKFRIGTQSEYVVLTISQE